MCRDDGAGREWKRRRIPFFKNGNHGQADHVSGHVEGQREPKQKSQRDWIEREQQVKRVHVPPSCIKQPRIWIENVLFSPIERCRGITYSGWDQRRERSLRSRSGQFRSRQFACSLERPAHGGADTSSLRG